MPRRNFRELEAEMSPERISASNLRVQKLVEEMPLNRLRAARKLTQEHLAKLLNRDQSAISQMERRTDMYVSTLADFIKAMGGELEIRANFPDGTVRISGIAETVSESAEPDPPPL
jgi:DNA-binding XRE family transcriptional regulator